MGNRSLKELICSTHGHELRGAGRNAGGLGAAGRKGYKGKKWGNCNSIINKIYLKKEKIRM